MEYEKMGLSQFLEAFDMDTIIDIIDSSDGEIYHGRVGDVKQITVTFFYGFNLLSQSC